MLEGYELIARHDAAASKRGIAVFALKELAPDITLLIKSGNTERMWFLLHTQLGPYLICCWYRRPDRGETGSIMSLRSEYESLKGQAVGTIIVGDLNIHQVKWLRYSDGNSPEGEEMANFCMEFGFSEYTRAPTREKYLLDLTLCDAQPPVDVRVVPGVSDHSMVYSRFDFSVSLAAESRRKVWRYDKANWSAMERSIRNTEWYLMDAMGVNGAANLVTSTLQKLMREHIPCKSILLRSSSHPWLNEQCLG